MSYKEKPQLKLYKYENNAFVLQAIIDDYQECSFEDNLYEAGQFSISINFNIPNSQLFQRGLFIQFGNSWKFGEITRIQDKIGEDGKGSQYRIITGYDARYILKRRVIKNMNSNGLWVMTGKGEIVLRNLINDQCGTNAEEKRKLPIINTIPDSETAVGKEYSASEQFSNLYEVCKTIATQSEIGWRIKFENFELTLECYSGTDRTQTVQFSTSFDSLANGEFIDSSESFANAIYVGGKGQNDDRDIYEGEDVQSGTPSGLDRFESWDNQSSMTTESEYETEALSMLNQYEQTLTMSGNGLTKCPYEYEKEYFTGDKIKIAFSGKSANAQILSVTEHWAFGTYEINFNFGKPLPDLNAQLQLMLKQIQKASNKTNSKDSVRWYDIPTDTEMPASDVTYNTIGFIGNVGTGATFTLYRDSSGTGSKTYHVYFKQLGGSGKLTLTTGVSEASNLVMNTGTYVAIIYVDENGNITSQGMTATSSVASGNNQPVTSDGVAGAISSEATARDNAINTAIQNIESIMSSLPTDAVLHYSFDEVPDYPDGTAVYFKNKNWTSVDWTCRQCTGSIQNGQLKLQSKGVEFYMHITSNVLSISNCSNKILIIKFRAENLLRASLQNDGGSYSYVSLTLERTSDYAYLAKYFIPTVSYNQLIAFAFNNTSADNYAVIESLYIGDGSYSTPVIDNANGEWNSISQSGVAVQGVSGKGISTVSEANAIILSNGVLPAKRTFSVWAWLPNSNWGSSSKRMWRFNLANYVNTDLINTEHRATFISRNNGNDVFSILYNCNQLLEKWVHFVIVDDLSQNGGNKILYVNGVKVAQKDCTGDFTGVTDNNPWTLFSCSHLSNNGALQGAKYDDFQVFYRALSDTEVLALYLNKANTPKYYSKADWKLEQMENANRSVRTVEEPPIEESGEEER